MGAWYNKQERERFTIRGVGGRERKNMRSYKRGCLVVRRRKGKVKGEGGKRVCCRYDIEREGKRIEEGRKSSEMRVRVRTTERPTCWSFWLIKVVCYPLIRSIASNIHGKYPTVSQSQQWWGRGVITVLRMLS